MGTKELRNRNNWQTIGGKKATEAEIIFYNTFKKEFEGTNFEILYKPKNFEEIYSIVELDEKTQSEIYNVDLTSLKNKKSKWGIQPDFCIRNIETNKSIFIEVKRQDGWIENGKPQDGRGNAHERGCKYFTPGLSKILIKESNINTDFFPLWIIYVGDITRDPKRNREIKIWFDYMEKNYFMWRNTEDIKKILLHFNEHIKKHLL